MAAKTAAWAAFFEAKTTILRVKNRVCRVFCQAKGLERCQNDVYGVGVVVGGYTVVGVAQWHGSRVSVPRKRRRGTQGPYMAYHGFLYTGFHGFDCFYGF